MTEQTVAWLFTVASLAGWTGLATYELSKLKRLVALQSREIRALTDWLVAAEETRRHRRVLP